MSTMVVTTRITYRYLMNKSKHDLAHMILAQCDMEEKLLAELTNTRDLLRTGCAPDAFVWTPEQWAQHKCNRAAGQLTQLLAEIGEKP